jgi:hypothetical protein
MGACKSGIGLATRTYFLLESILKHQQTMIERSESGWIEVVVLLL